jgi:hypothetical protein
VSLWRFHHAVMPFVLPSPALFGGSAWGGQILEWVGAPSYHGPVLARGRKLTGSDGLGFGDGKVPWAEMDVPGGAAGASASTLPAGGRGRGKPEFVARDATACKATGPRSARSSSSGPASRAILCARPAAASHGDR